MFLPTSNQFNVNTMPDSWGDEWLDVKDRLAKDAPKRREQRAPDVLKKIKQLVTELVRSQKITKRRGYTLLNKTQYILHKEVNNKMTTKQATKSWERETGPDSTSQTVYKSRHPGCPNMEAATAVGCQQ